jgi:hypothetical protein
MSGIDVVGRLLLMRRRQAREQAVASLLALLNVPEDQVCQATVVSGIQIPEG